jgi:hypothetical protein
MDAGRNAIFTHIFPHISYQISGIGIAFKMDFSEIFGLGYNVCNLEKANLRMKIVAEVEGGNWLAVDAAGECLLRPAPDAALKGQFKAGKFIKIIGNLRKISADTLEISPKAIICPIR